MYIESEPDIDVDDPPLRYCPACKCEVHARVVDESFGYSYGSINGVHRQERIECPNCEGSLLDSAPEREESEEG